MLMGLPARAETVEGTHEGADFMISVPANWNGGLVMYAHGYQGELPGRGTVQVSPMSDHLTGKGIAWAATGYRAVTYRPDWFLEDVLALRQRFIKQVGPVRWTVIHGLSMGGHVAVAGLELHPGIFQGAITECGVVDGVGLIAGSTPIPPRRSISPARPCSTRRGRRSTRWSTGRWSRRSACPAATPRAANNSTAW